MAVDYGFLENLLMLVIRLVPFVIAVWVLVTLAAIRRGVDRTAIAVESLAAAQHSRS